MHLADRSEQPSQSEPVAQPVAVAAQPERKEVPKDLVPPQTFSKCKRGRQKVRPSQRRLVLTAFLGRSVPLLDRFLTSFIGAGVAGGEQRWADGV